MAKVTYGPIVGQASGSVGATVFSRNRYGTYARRRAIPTISTTVDAINAKARLSGASQAWGAITPEQRLAWVNWALANPITDVLGVQQALTGHAAFTGNYARMNRAGDTELEDPPVVGAPAALLTMTATFDIGAGTSVVTFTPTPLGTDHRLWLQAAVVNSASINYVQNLLRLVHVSAKDLATDYDYQAVVEAKFGALQVGQKVVLLASVFDGATGLLSGPRRVEGVVESTV